MSDPDETRDNWLWIWGGVAAGEFVIIVVLLVIIGRLQGT